VRSAHRLSRPQFGRELSAQVYSLLLPMFGLANTKRIRPDAYLIYVDIY